jgi:tetratricopeptide (TPR) repeat protein
VLRHLGRTAEFQQAFGEAADLLEQLAAETPNLPRYRSKLANAYFWRMRGLPPSGEAEQYLRQALTLQMKLVDDFPAVADYRYDLFRSQRTLGWLLGAMNRSDDAEAAFHEAAANAQKLIAVSPSVHYYRGGLALTYLALGRYLTERDRPRDAEDAFRQAIALFEKLVIEFPAVPTYKPDLCETYCDLASVLNTSGRPDEARAIYRKALALNPHDPTALRGISELQSSPVNKVEEDIQEPESQL